ncbi:MAG: protein-L-isoaspartate(D-aspartate) O-methyltransferase [Hyphomicrobiaceae bacterium]|nr:protein-L-isoaspartate(D-aspartate) O-methyltransferase [Hyphomicrobiaceae bacterium]
MRIRSLLALALFAAPPWALADVGNEDRAAMVKTIRDYARLDTQMVGPGGIPDTVLDAMGKTKRHLFVPERVRAFAYADRPLRIGHGQTISQPFIVALMTHLAGVEPGDTVLEIGTGSGYQAAILARLVKQVCTIEIVEPLGQEAAERLKELGYDNVRVRVGDGYKGWPECGPFDAIVVTAALGHVPPPLLEQLKVGGKLVMPVGPPGATQRMTVVKKTSAEETQTRHHGLVRFVPFTRKKE